MSYVGKTLTVADTDIARKWLKNGKKYNEEHKNDMPIIVLNKNQMRNKQLVYAFKAKGWWVIRGKSCPHLLPCTSESKKLLLELECPDDKASILHHPSVKRPVLSKVQRQLKKWKRQVLSHLSLRGR